ncbi:U-box domain-containing protein 34 [Platanthera guangdongensis]|uniref:RING-type E3 ubiquitin transferase n=1 Tax=Platanthera guangdongensis TaxID=2320717 RepID=A0ABR2N3F7_9ASPA
MPSAELSDATVAIAVCSGGRSCRAVRWAAKKLVPYAHRVLLIHVIPFVSFIPSPSGRRIPIKEMDARMVELFLEDVKLKAEEVFLPFRRICSAENVKVETVVMFGASTADALLKYMSDSGIKNLVLGSSSLGWVRSVLKGPDVSALILKSATSSCNIFVVSRHNVTLKFADQLLIGGTGVSMQSKTISRKTFSRAERSHQYDKQSSPKSSEIHDLFLPPEDVDNVSDISGNSELSLKLPSLGNKEENNVDGRNTQVKKWVKSDISLKDVIFMALRFGALIKKEAPSEVVGMKLELQKTLALYNQICDDLICAKNKVLLLDDKSCAESKKVGAAREMAKRLETIKEVKETRNMLARESKSRQKQDNFARKISFEKPNAFDALFYRNKRFRRFSSHEIECATDNFSDSRKIGEGAYGCVYKCNLDHIPVAVKAVSSDASYKKEEFLREVEILSQLYHPHMVSLLGVCPENGCLVYEYMENGSLEDQLFNTENSPMLSWFIRFRIIFEVACGLSFLHGNKPDPIVHRDLKPGNILLDKNYASKIGDVGLAKLISDIVPDSITEYRDTTIAGTLYYMDPEYQRTGTIRPKSDTYALGIIALQLLTGKKMRGLMIHVEDAIEDGTFADILDKSLSDWPVIEAEKVAKIALKCCKLRCRDRPDLESEVLPELEQVFTSNACFGLKLCNVYTPRHYLCPILQEEMEEPSIAADGYTYELRAIRAWLERHKVSPITGLSLPHTEIIPNNPLRLEIQQWRSRSSVSWS